jgi:hypothetical protein
MNELRINSYITLQLKWEKTVIYIGGERFRFIRILHKKKVFISFKKSYSAHG